jgi:2,4-dienoyl-CoA reductase-like NADH-dependent reductase (Old Yellow Enzyme family)
MSQNQVLFTPFQLGALTLPNRFVMAPMTRSRANNPGNVPTESTVKYYVQLTGFATGGRLYLYAGHSFRRPSRGLEKGH